MSFRLKGSIAIVTGGSRGIGEAIATSFAREGARVVITARKPEALEETASKINKLHPQSVVAHACHVGKKEQVEELVAWTQKELGLPNVLVNNAGTNPHFGPMLEASEAQFDKTFEVNLKGPFELTRLLANQWLEKEVKGVVVNIASIAGESAAPFQGIYGMTKAALISMTQTLALELGRRGVRINAIAPGLVDTKLSAALTQNPDLAKMFTDRTALGRYGQPEEIAELVVYLASDESRYVTGQTFNVDGGYSIA